MVCTEHTKYLVVPGLSVSKLKLLRGESKSTEGTNRGGEEGGREEGDGWELFVWFY